MHTAAVSDCQDEQGWVHKPLGHSVQIEINSELTRPKFHAAVETARQ